jgi:hypothetical protein
LAIKELRHHLDSFRQDERAQSLEGNVEVLACIVFLISLEVFLGDTQSWHIHLQAAQSLVCSYSPKACDGMFAADNLAYSCQASERGADASLASQCLQVTRRLTGFSLASSLGFVILAAYPCSVEEVMLTGVPKYDIISSATTGSKAWASPVCLDTQLGFVNLEIILGCENSVMLAILDTTELKAWKATSQEAGTFSVSAFVNGAMRIERFLLEMLDHCAEIFKQALLLGSSTRKDQLTDGTLVKGVCRTSQTSAITRIFTCAALVNLNVLLYGPLPDHPKVYESVSRTITALKELRNRAVLGMLAWPLCIAGSMASDSQMEFFRQLSLDFDGVCDMKAGNLKRSFAVVEECWRLRKDGSESPDWQQSMESLKMKILLI